MQSEIASHDKRRAQNILIEVKYDLDRVRFHISTAERHREELQRKYKDVNELSLRLRDEEERYGLIWVSEREAPVELRRQAVSAESSAEQARKDVDVMLGAWVNDSGGAIRGDTGVYQ